MEVTKSLSKICSESILFPRIESMPSAPPMGEPKRVDDFGFTTIRPGIFTNKEPELFVLGISLRT